MTDQDSAEVFEDSPEQGEEIDEIRIAFDEATELEADEDDTKMAMIGAGATFKNVTRFYNQYMIDAGLAISKADRNELVAQTLEGAEFDTEEAFDEAVGNLVAAVQGATDRSAAALIRSYAKKNELECYSKPKGEGVARSSFASKFYDMLAATPGGSKEDATAFINGDGECEDTSKNVKAHLSHYMAIWKLARRIEEGKGVAQAA